MKFCTTITSFKTNRISKFKKICRLENSKSAIFYSGYSNLQNFLFSGIRFRIISEGYTTVKNGVSCTATGNIRKIKNKNLLKIAKNTIFGETTVTMETILCSRILQIFSTKYLITRSYYRKESANLVPRVFRKVLPHPQGMATCAIC